MAALCLTAGLAVIGAPAGGNVFGDGDPGNGTEDDRRALNLEPASDDFPLGPPLAAGTVFCDGALRGTAILVDVSALVKDAPGRYLATAAHVLLDLDTGLAFGSCEFHYRNLGQLPGYQAALLPRWTRSGPFDPAGDRDSAGLGEHDWAFAYLPDPGRPRDWPRGLPPRELVSLEPAAGAPHYHLLAFDAGRRALSITAVCQAVASVEGDLGGGAWRGQYLDDCDSGAGASGGGLIAVVGNSTSLVGIRTGSHWSAEEFPAWQFPGGPPDGEPWSVSGNTNFCRAIDAGLIEALRALATDAKLAEIRREPAAARLSGAPAD